MSSDDSGTISIRAATVADERALVELARRLASSFDLPPWRRPDDIATADAREMMEAIRSATAGNDVFIAERGGVPVGCLHVLATTVAAEGSGVGRALAEYAEVWARRRGHSLLTLNVFAANERARRFYERAGLLPEMLKYAKPLVPAVKP